MKRLPESYRNRLIAVSISSGITADKDDDMHVLTELAMSPLRQHCIEKGTDPIMVIFYLKSTNRNLVYTLGHSST